MSGLKRLFLPVLVFGMTVLPARSQLEAAETRATIQGVSHANLRAGPSLNQPVTSILNEGDQLKVEGQEGEWYLVTTAEGQRGYVHKSVVKLAAGGAAPVSTETPGQPSPAGELEKAPPNEIKETAEKSKGSTLSTTTPTHSAVTPEVAPQSVAPSRAAVTQSRPPVTRPTEQKTPTPKPRSLIQLLEGREADVMLWAAIGFAFFWIGWICGGNYYLRRDRFRRTKLRF